MLFLCPLCRIPPDAIFCKERRVLPQSPGVPNRLSVLLPKEQGPATEFFHSATGPFLYYRQHFMSLDIFLLLVVFLLALYYNQPRI